MRDPATPRRLDLETWPRREHFRFFRAYEHPYFNICAEVDVAPLVRRRRRTHGPSLFLVSSFYLSLQAVNEIEEFHYRIRGDEVVVHEVVHGGSTVLRPDGTFGFAYFDYLPDFEAFSLAAEEVLRGARTASLDPRDDRDDLVHYSVIPWISFTSFSHARRRNPEDSTPKIVFGRYHGEPENERMPVSIEVHHALMDGLHVGRFFERFQQSIHAFDSDGPTVP
jgi:chloramphenicol O-acetyltransferase type A